MDGEVVTNRRFEEILAGLCRQHDITHRVFSDGWVHEFERAGRIVRLIGYKWSLNDAAASAIAADKVATYQLLAAHDVAAVEHLLVRTQADFSPHFPADLPDQFVLKPLTGASSRGVRLCASRPEAVDHIRDTKISD